MRYLILITVIIIDFNYSVNGQFKSTVFMDSVIIIYKNDTLLSKDFNKVYYLDNDKNKSLSIFKNDSMEVIYNFSSSFFYRGIMNHFFRKPENISNKDKNYILDPCGIDVIEKNNSNSFLYNQDNYIQPNADSADIIINKYIEAVGGLDKLETIHSVYMQGSVLIRGQKTSSKTWKRDGY